MKFKFNPFKAILSAFASLGIPAPADLEGVEVEGSLGRAALRVATSEIGNGEYGGNNVGPDVDRYRTHDGTGIGPGGKGSWCAVFVSFCFMRAAKLLFESLPFKTSRGAKALFKLICKAGARVSKPQPGDVACFHRGPKNSWKGHIAFVDWVKPDGTEFVCVEGNAGPKVKRKRHKITDPDLIGFGRI